MTDEFAREQKTVLVTGATGFVGSQVLTALRGNMIRALIRSPKSRLPEGVEPVVGDVTNPQSLVGVCDGVDVVVHLVGIIEESNGATFDDVIRKGTEHIVEAAASAGVGQFVLMSALGAQSDPHLPYMRAKFRAEAAVQESGIPYAIFRPSVIFGPGDGFVNALASVIRSFPVVPVVGDGKARFQPVAVTDVADAFAAVVGDPDQARDQIVELGGGELLTYEEIIDALAEELGKKKPKIHVPVGLMKIVVKVSSPFPKTLRPPVTLEQLKMLSLDNSTSPHALEQLIGRPAMPLRGNIDYVRSS